MLKNAGVLPTGMNFEIGKSAARAADALAAIVIVLTFGYLWILAGERDLAGYGTETDFIGSMVGEAARVLNGEPLLTDFHPPFFSLTLAAVNSAVGDWLAAGRLISVVSAVITLISTHIFFRTVINAWIGLGAVLGLISGAVFWEYAILATSDVYALALYSLTFMAAALAFRRQSIGLWFLTGVLLVLTVMTRTNGITLLLLLAFPLLQLKTGAGLRGLLASIVGFAAAVLGFIGFAHVTGSSLMPEGTYHNLALTYFTEERIAWEGMTEARARFNSLSDVLLYDPAAMAKGYLRDFYDVAFRKAPYLAGPILAFLFLPGLVIAGLSGRRLLFLAFLAATIAQLLLVNLKAYEPRYHMYLLPWIGAGSALFLAWVLGLRGVPGMVRHGIAVLLGGAILIGPVLAARETGRLVARGSNPELAAVLERVGDELGEGDVVIARKIHISFYTGARYVELADVTTESELRETFAGLVTDGTVAGDIHLFIGAIERRRRPAVAALVATAPAWLTPVAVEDRPDGWALYRYTPAAGG